MDTIKDERAASSPPWTGVFCMTSCIPSGCFFWGGCLGGLFVSLILFGGFQSHRAENLVCTHHWRRPPNKSFWLFLSALALRAVSCAFFLPEWDTLVTFLYTLSSVFLRDKNYVTVLLNQKYTFPPPNPSHPPETSRSHGCLCLSNSCSFSCFLSLTGNHDYRQARFCGLKETACSQGVPGESFSECEVWTLRWLRRSHFFVLPAYFIHSRPHPSLQAIFFSILYVYFQSEVVYLYTFF